MKKIASFTVDHTVLEKGMYISRVDGDAVTYDIRMKKPNNNDYLTPEQAHTIEHLFATYARNSEFSDDIIYVGPMGCQTGFYLIVRDKMSHLQSLKLTQDSMKFIADYEGEIPGNSAVECGNYLLHDLFGAKRVAKDMMNVLKDYTVEKMNYTK